jgi:glutamate/tyrosine decarboxylase-like PLP-dependent enzyme
MPIDSQEPSPDRESRSPLDPSPEWIRELGREVVEFAASYYGSLRDVAVYPRTSSAELRSRLAEPLPTEGRDISELLRLFQDVVVPGSRHNGHPRALGYVSSPGTAVAAMADFLASVLNANLTAWRSSPAPVELERVAIGWIREAMGLDPAGGGLFLSGGSMAHLAALTAARHHHCGEDVAAEGLQSMTRPLRVYASKEVHHSIDKAAAILGIGHRNVRRIAVDSALRLRVDELERAIEEDRAAGRDPLCIVATAGTVVTGAVDPLAAIAEVARRQKVWLHVDACYGGFARLATSTRHLFDGLEQADSMALDPHKWMYLPVDCGCLLYRDAEASRAAFVLGADYTRMIVEEQAEAFAFWDYGPELTRRFRALKVWMVMAHVGARALGEAVESNLDCARYLAGRIGESAEFELSAPVALSIVCFRHLPERFRGRPRSEADEREVDDWNERVLVALQQGGSSYLSNASIDGRFALRGCVINYRTTRADMDVLLDDVRRAADEVAAGRTR